MEATKSYSEAARPETLHLLLPKYSHFVFICFFISSVSSSVSFFFRARKSWLFIAIPMTPKKFYCHNPLTQVFNTSVSVKVPWALGTAICIVIFITGNALLALNNNYTPYNRQRHWRTWKGRFWCFLWGKGESERRWKCISMFHWMISTKIIISRSGTN